MSQLAENSPAVMAAYREFKRFTMDDDMQDLERRRRRYVEDWHIGMNAAKEDGYVEGKAEGMAEGMAEIARNMRQKGYDAKTIAELTGLSLAEIKRLR